MISLSRRVRGAALIIPWLCASMLLLAAPVVAQDDYILRENTLVDSFLGTVDTLAGQEAYLTEALGKDITPDLRLDLLWRRANLRITHLDVRKGVQDMEAYEALLIKQSSENPEEDKSQFARELIEARRSLSFSRRKLSTNEEILADPSASKLERFAAHWALGQRDKAVELAKTHPNPAEFSSFATRRLINAGYLCERLNHDRTKPSFITRNSVPYWWCDAMESKPE